MTIKTQEEAKSFDIENQNKQQIFMVYGEDQSCGGSFDRANVPFLGHFEGTAQLVLKYAESLDGWKSWGRGGKLELYTPPTITPINSKSLREKLEKEQRILELEQELKNLKK